MSKNTQVGTCKLTGDTGRYVKAHILPQALTRLSMIGEKYVEAGLERDGQPFPIIRRPTSWYDTRLVTAKGERLLASIDDKAIAELRALRLVWSGWGTSQRLESDDLVVKNGQAVCREIRPANPDILRLFFLSIVWRAAASSMPECELVSLAHDELEDLRLRVLSRDPGPAIDYPLQLFQIITRGDPHNRTPLLEQQPVPKRDGSGPIMVHCVRIYLDGLVAYVYFPRRNKALDSGFFNFCVGVQDVTTVMAHEFERSRTAANRLEVISVTEWAKRRPTTPEKMVARAIRAMYTARGAKL
jgi:hypothetical protein